MGMMIVRHKVRDYDQWRPIFDGHVEVQRAAGLINPRVYHSADSNKSEIVVVFDTEDTRMAKAFAASADHGKNPCSRRRSVIVSSSGDTFVRIGFGDLAG